MADDADYRKRIEEAGKRALAEAEERRRIAESQPAAERPPERGGPKGAEPVRHGDWERKGIAVDF